MTVSLLPAAPAKKPLYQSASRDETFNTCSQLYAAKYLWRLPDPGNDGAHRGSVCHDALELLLKPRHKHLFDAAVQCQTCTEVPALQRLIERYARKYRVADPVNLRLIDQFMMVALMNEFYGPKGTVQAIAEREFSFDVNEPDGRRYRIRGFVDKTFIVQDAHGLILQIVDYKGSKARFEGEKATFNAQKIIYELAARRLHPDISRRRFRFLFLRFPKSPWQEEPSMTDAQLYGYEWMLTDMQTAMEAFTLDNAGDNLAAFDEEKRWLCGVPDAIKKDGTPRWCCSAHKPLDYWVIADEAGEIVESAFTEEELVGKVDAAKGQSVEARHFPGCKAFWRDGRRMNFQ